MKMMTRSMMVACVAVLAACDSGGGDTTEKSSGVVLINEVAPAGEPNDWVELYNPGEVAVSLAGWTMTDSKASHVFEFADDAEIAAGGYMLLERNVAGSFAFGLGNDDAVVLIDNVQGTSDVTSWVDDDAPAGTSWGRIPNGTGNFKTLYATTPGEANVDTAEPECGNDAIEWGEVCEEGDFEGATCESLKFLGGDLACEDDCARVAYDGCETVDSPVVINEVTSTGTDRIELYNNGDEDIDLANWKVVDGRPDNADDVFAFPSLDTSIISPGEYIVLYKGDQHLFGLGEDDLVVLRNAAGQIVDIADWPAGQATNSYCRLPNGTGEFSRCDMPSFGAANQL